VDETGAVDAVVVVDVRVKGADGKLYPPLMPAPGRERLRAIEHDLHCRQGLSIRATQTAMLRQGIRRSRGQVHKDLTWWRCPYCPAEPKPPDPAQRPRSYQWR
jgi:hypothetical protein